MVTRQHEDQILLVPIPPLASFQFRYHYFIIMPEYRNPVEIIFPYSVRISIIVPKLLWVSITPLGEPVVPLEYGNRQTSSGLKIGDFL